MTPKHKVINNKKNTKIIKRGVYKDKISNSNKLTKITKDDINQKVNKYLT